MESTLSLAPPMVKVCGISLQTREIDALGVPLIGHIFWPPSKRYAPKWKGFNTQYFNNIKAKRIGVFVDWEPKEILKTVDTYQLDGIQFHGNEPASQLLEVRTLRPDLFLVKAFSVNASFDFAETAPYEAVAELFIFDASGDLPGGNGHRFDWSRLRQYQGHIPYLLSGGIGPLDLPMIKEFKQEYPQSPFVGVDLNSKFELSAGVKDLEKLKEFLSHLESLWKQN